MLKNHRRTWSRRAALQLLYSAEITDQPIAELLAAGNALVLENERLFVGTPSQLAFVAEVYNINRVILLFLNVGQIISPNIGTWGTMTYNIHQQQPIPELITHIAIEPSCLTRRAREEHREAIA